MRTAVDRLVEQFEEMSDDDPWDDLSLMSRTRLWLTKTEAEQLGKELTELVDRYRRAARSTNHPAGTRQVGTLLAVVPLGNPPEEG